MSASAATHNRAPARHTAASADPSPASPVTWRSSAATANATNGITAAFSKNSSPPK